MILRGQKLYLCKDTVADRVRHSKQSIFNLMFLTCLAIRWCHWTGSCQQSVCVSNVSFPVETENCLGPYSLLSLFPCYSNCQRLGSPRADIETELGYKVFIRDQYLLREGGEIGLDRGRIYPQCRSNRASANQGEFCSNYYPPCCSELSRNGQVFVIPPCSISRLP